MNDNYHFIFSILLVESCIGLLLNGFLLISIGINYKSKKFDKYAFNIGLLIVDSVLSLVIFSRYCISIAKGSFFTIPFGPNCFFDAFAVLFCYSLGITTISCGSYFARVFICNGVSLTKCRTIIGATISISFALSAATSVTAFTTSGYGADTSGTYCIFFGYDYVSIIYVSVILSIVLTFFAYNILLISRSVIASQVVLNNLGVSGRAKGHYLYMITRLHLFLSAFFVPLTPFLGGKLYEAISGPLTPSYSAFIGLFVLASPFFIDPLLLVFVNLEVREMVADSFHSALSFISPRSKIKIHPQSEMLHGSNETEWEVWMHHSYLKTALYDHAKKQLADENLRFYEDVCSYKQKISSLRECLIEDQSKDVLCAQWKDINILTNQIYLLYIKVPTAPLEININSSTRESILQKLNITDRRSSITSMMRRPKQDNGCSLEQPVQFPDLSYLTKDDIDTMLDNYLLVFDEALKAVSHIILTDIWSRFIKTTEYHDSLSHHMNQIV